MTDELARLGLVDRSVRLMAGTAVWDDLARLMKPRSDLIAAIASVGAGGAGLLPLGRGTSVVTNASLEAVRSGATDPGVLLRWVEAGAYVYSLENLQATMILAQGAPAFVALASPGSAHAGLEGVVVVSDDPVTVRESRRALQDWKQRAGSPLTVTALRGWLDQFGVDRPSVVRPVAAVAPPRAVAPSAPRLVVVPSADPGPTNPGPTLSAVPAAPPTPVRTVIPPKGVVPLLPSRSFPGAMDREAGPRPKTLTVTGIFLKGEPSPEAERRLATLKDDHESDQNVGVVEMFWWDLAPGSSNVRLYRDGEYVVGVDLGETGRRQKKSPLWPPGRVVHTYTDGAAWPVRVYCYLMIAGTDHTPTLGDAQSQMLSIGEKLEFDRGYMRGAVIDTILGLWPDVSYIQS